HIFASADHPNIFLIHLVPLADIITPNLFELSVLSGSQKCNYDDIITACKKLISKTGNHNQIIIVTLVSFSKDKTGIAIYHPGTFSYRESPKYKVQPKVSGSG
ncbi:bifunctional hydroxymethylpyrimidine kinase/phosphomethylpyrimidine kinase, partial [Francisella tularensis subsp. holarctica]|uniref:bifunctional hydroxymethylpyrimidine kinase/phosphomethylpyrimidine kinase n=1 Tax=Francisella tularensis TaxID=263 RepID=UPI002381AB6D